MPCQTAAPRWRLLFVVFAVWTAGTAVAGAAPIDWHAAVTAGDAPQPAVVLSCPGCCSSHGGISSTCASNGRIYCNDGTISPSCSCSSCGVSTTPPPPPPPTCSGGQYYDGTRCVCPSGQAYIAGYCTTCTNGHVVSSSGTTCVCPSGKVEQGGVCVSSTTTPPSFAIGGGISGNWYHPSQSGHGFQIEVLKDPLGYATAFWFVFDNDGNQAWIAGTGQISGNQIVMNSARRLGARFPPYFDANSAQGVPWGTITFTFTDCTHGHVAWTATDPSFTSAGSMDIQRLTQILGTSCP